MQGGQFKATTTRASSAKRRGEFSKVLKATIAAGLSVQLPDDIR
jgi:hypothetical protein